MAERRERFETSSGIELPNDFNPENTTPVDYGTDLGEPGQFPYTRGVRKNLYRGRFWTMRQYAGFATAEESNARYKYLLSQGTTGLSVAFDLPTQIGLDIAGAEAGQQGVRRRRGHGPHCRDAGRIHHTWDASTQGRGGGAQGGSYTFQQMRPELLGFWCFGSPRLPITGFQL